MTCHLILNKILNPYHSQEKSRETANPALSVTLSPTLTHYNPASVSETAKCSYLRTLVAPSPSAWNVVLSDIYLVHSFTTSKCVLQWQVIRNKDPPPSQPHIKHMNPRKAFPNHSVYDSTTTTHDGSLAQALHPALFSVYHPWHFTTFFIIGCELCNRIFFFVYFWTPPTIINSVTS